MADAHGRYEQLAVGHVLGGLGTHEAADFRTHLMACPVCRRRVAELRDIAADLEAAEVDERQRASVQTAAPRRPVDAPEDATGRGPRGAYEGAITVRHVTLAVVVVLLLAGAMAFWNLHLRGTVALQGTVTEQDAQVLEALSSGVVLDATLGDGVDGIVVLGDEQVGVSLVGVGELGARESIVAWLLGADGIATSESVLLARPGQLADGLLRGVLATGAATELVISREVGEVGERPQGDRLVEVGLTPGR